MQTVVISPRGEERLQSGHPWIYRADLADVKADAGARVAVLNRRGRTLGYALYSDRSQIALRMLTDGDVVADDELIAETNRGRRGVPRQPPHRCDRVPARARRSRSPAFAHRRSLRRLPGRADAVARDGSADAAGGRRASEAAAARAAFSRRNDPRTRLLEGLEQKVEVLAGRRPRVDERPRAGGRVRSRSAARPENRAVPRPARESRGGRAVRARPRARLLQLQRRLRARDGPAVRPRSSPSTSRRTRSRPIRANASRNGVAVDARVGNVFDELRGLERLGERFDTIVLDPPAFAKSKTAVEKATAGYKEINLRALKLLSPGGTLVTCSCSYNVNEAAFAEIVYDASVDARAHVTVVEKRMQAPRSSGDARRARDLLLEVLHPAKAGMSTPAQAARAVRRELKALARPAGGIRRQPLLPRRRRSSASTTSARPGCARSARRSIVSIRLTWSIEEATDFAAGAHHQPGPRRQSRGDRAGGVLPASHLRHGCCRSGNAGCRRGTRATGRRPTASAARSSVRCSSTSPASSPAMRPWAGHRSLWVRRAAAVSLIPSVRRGLALDLAYDVAARLHPDGEDLIQKAVGWMLREAGKADVARLDAYLLARGIGHPADDAALCHRALSRSPAQGTVARHQVATRAPSPEARFRSSVRQFRVIVRVPPGVSR